MTAGATRRRLAGSVLVLLSIAVCLLSLSALLPVAPGDSLAPQPAVAGAQEPAPVWFTRVEGIIDPALASYLTHTMEDAVSAGAAALIVEIDTPGGLDSSMRDIIQAELDSPIPVIFYVYPQGARAASAGLYILMGSDVAAMAPQTNVGAATPVALGGGEIDETLQTKIINDAAAYIRGLASTHGRNADWAERAVREGVSLPAEDALEQNVIEFVVPDLSALLQAIDGYRTVPKGLTVHTAGAPIQEVEMGWIQRFLHGISNPDIAFVLLTLGVLGIILELTTPGLGAAGIAGVICLLLSFYSLQVLPVSWVGIALIVLAIALFVAELLVESQGILGVGGAAALITGGLLLFDTSASFLKVSWPVLLAVGVIVLIFFLVVIRAVRRAMRRPPATGVESLVGRAGTAVTALDPSGQVRVSGEVWKARVEGLSLVRDEPIEVLGNEGLTLIVRKQAGPPSPASDFETNHTSEGENRPWTQV